MRILGTFEGPLHVRVEPDVILNGALQPALIGNLSKAPDSCARRIRIKGELYLIEYSIGLASIGVAAAQGITYPPIPAAADERERYLTTNCSSRFSGRSDRRSAYTRPARHLEKTLHWPDVSHIASSSRSRPSPKITEEADWG
jgi:hypothetical protein